MKEWHKKYFTAGNMTVVAVGDFDSSLLVQQLEKLFGDLKGKPAKQLQVSAQSSSSEENTLVETRLKAQTAQVVDLPQLLPIGMTITVP